VATVRALKMHGGKKVAELGQVSVPSVERGLANLEKHVESIRNFKKRPIVALNRFHTDSDEEIAVVRSFCDRLVVPFAVATHYTDGGAGAVELAKAVMKTASTPGQTFAPLYPLDAPVQDKVRIVAQKMYGADDVAFTKSAEHDLREIEELGYAQLPVCIAKTQSSLSDDPNLRGRPRDFEVTVRGIQINAGAGFLVVLTGDILRMPGLPRVPQATSIDLVDGEIVGLK